MVIAVAPSCRASVASLAVPLHQARLLEPLEYAVVKNLLTGEVLPRGGYAHGHGGAHLMARCFTGVDITLVVMPRSLVGAHCFKSREAIDDVQMVVDGLYKQVNLES